MILTIYVAKIVALYLTVFHLSTKTGFVLLHGVFQAQTLHFIHDIGLAVENNGQQI